MGHGLVAKIDRASDLDRTFGARLARAYADAVLLLKSKAWIRL